MNEPLLELHEVTKSFGAVRALGGVSFDLQPGEVHALLGENGAGKSTLIKIITGAHRPDRGIIRVQGETVRSLTPTSAHQLGIACIYQQPALFPDLSVAENVALRLEPATGLRRIGWKARHARATQLLKRVGARLSSETIVRELSMPEQQLVEIACALGAAARILIMDEPTSSLTHEEQDRLLRLIDDLRKQGVGIIYISHRLEEIFRIADRVTVLRDGATVGTGLLSGGESWESIAGEKESGASHARSFTQPQLIHLMVGREVSQIYPPSEREPGEVMLALRGIGCAASGVHDVSFELRAGEVLGLSGMVGAGRTELARILFGLTPADSGEILIEGQSIRITSPRDAIARGIAYLPEDRRRHGIILDLPIAANVSLASHRHLFPGTWLREGVERRLTESYLMELSIKVAGPHALGHTLSGGNQQKIALARWLATEPKILILDEPTQGVDVGAKVEIHGLIRRLARQGMAVLMISSDLPEVLGMSDRIVVMRSGTVVSVLPGGSEASEVMTVALGGKGELT